MFIDARSLPSGTTVAADICVVGAGAAGLTIAREFAGRAIKVCLLESGGLRFRWDVQSLYRGANIGLPYFGLDVCQLRYFGGNTNAWGGWCRPLDAIDFKARPWVPDSGWPISRAELESHYEAAHAVCQLPTADYAAQSWCRRLHRGNVRLLAFDPRRIEPSVYQFSPPTRFGRLYRSAVGAAANLHCFLNANVLKVRADGDARSVTHLEVGTLAGNRFAVTASLFVLAAGGIENARLLLLSNDVMTTGLGNGYDLVGRYFMEHPHTKRALIPFDRAAPVALYGLRFHDQGVSVRLDLPPALQEQEGLLHYSANIHPVYFAHDSDGWRAFRKLVLSLSPTRRTDPYVRFPPYGSKGLSAREIWDTIREFDKVTVAAFLQLLQPEGLVAGYILESKSEQAPNRDSHVTLDQERDAFGLNRVRLDWRMLPIDRRTVRRGEEILQQELWRLGVGTLAPSLPEEVDEWPGTLEGGWHQMGTTRMHADPRRGVVDPDGRVHGLSNLFIAGASIFPTGGAAPPTLTIVAMALRLAAHLKKRLTGEPLIVSDLAPAAAVVAREPQAAAAAAAPGGLLARPGLAAPPG
jgi:choline dehydrogenase-like flavoprotein